MKEAASQKIETVTDATSTLSKGIKKSFRNYRKEAGRYAQSCKVDVEEMFKSINQVANPDKHKSIKTSVIHTTIDWAKYPRSAFRRGSDPATYSINSINEDDEETTDSEEEDDVTAANDDVISRYNLHTTTNNIRLTKITIDHSQTRRKEYNSRRISSTCEKMSSNMGETTSPDGGRKISTASFHRSSHSS